MRLTLFCMSAPKLPIVMDSAAEIQISGYHPVLVVANKTRSITANAAALGPVDIKATTGAGAPSYTSGVHMWKGADATLKPRPTIISATAMKARTPGTRPVPTAMLISSMLVEPVAPNMSATPYRKNAVANDPSRKYLMADSALPAFRRRYPARMYVEMEEISSAIKISTSSTADDISTIPTVPNR